MTITEEQKNRILPLQKMVMDYINKNKLGRNDILLFAAIINDAVNFAEEKLYDELDKMEKKIQ